MFKWTKMKSPDGLAQDPMQIYVIPCFNGSKILFRGEECFIKDVTVLDIIDTLEEEFGQVTYHISREDIEKIIERCTKEN